MDNLQARVRGFLVSEQFDIIQDVEGLIVSQKDAEFGNVEMFLFWVVPTLDITDDELPGLERRIVTDLVALNDKYPKSKRFLVAHSRGEFSSKFKAELSRFSVKQLAEVEFFDSPFRLESKRGSQAVSAVSELRDTRVGLNRVPQPYQFMESGRYSPGTQGDLFETLFDANELISPSRPRLNLVMGPAGIGKTYLFQALFSRLYETFIKRKGQREIFPRPIPLISAYLRQSSNRRIEDILNTFIDTEVAAHRDAATFKWMVLNNYAMWMFDGLDELYAEDAEFFYTLMEILEAPGSKAQIFLFSRESLLSSSKNFIEFLQAYPPPGTKNVEVNLFKLDNWERSSKRYFAWHRFADAKPAKGDIDPPRVASFLSFIETTQPLRMLSSLPFYCNLLAEEFQSKNGASTGFQDDFDLLGYALSKIVEREVSKEDIKGEKIQLLNLEHFQEGGFDEWLQATANEYCARNFQGVDIETLEIFAGAVLHPGLSEQERKDTVTTLIQFPLFGAAESNVISFQHELIAEYLAGLHWKRRIAKNPVRAGIELGSRTDFAESLLARFLAHSITGDLPANSALCDALKWEKLRGRAFANLLQILVYAAPHSQLLRDAEISFEGKDLSYVKVYNQDLARASFKGCDLTNTLFSNCNLADAQFEGALLIGTQFERIQPGALAGANFGNLEFFESLNVEKRQITDEQEMIAWLSTVTANPDVRAACPAALQLRQLFLKFIDPFGNGRRDKLKEIALVSGRRYPKAARPHEFVEACIRLGYLQEPDFRGYIGRSLGDYYDEMVDYILSWKISPKLRDLLDDVCPIRECLHAPGTKAIAH